MKLYSSFAIMFLLCLSINQSVSALGHTSELTPPILDEEFSKEELFVKRECASSTSLVTAACPIIPGFPHSGGTWVVASTNTTVCTDNGVVVGIVSITQYMGYDSNPCQVPGGN
jgi:hypothetical protein